MKIIDKIEIKNFRSFSNRKGETISIDKVNQLNIISGANDSGKSNILRGLNLFFNGFTEFEQFFQFQRDFFIKENKDDLDIKEEVVTIKIWFHNSKNEGKNFSDKKRVFLPEKFWVSKKWKKTTEYSQSDVTSNITKSFEYEKKEHYQDFLDGQTIKSMTKASLQKQLTDYLGSIQYHYIPAIKDRQYFSHLYGELQQTLWKSVNSNVDKKRADLQSEIQKETEVLMNDFQETLVDKNLDFTPSFELPQNMIELFRTLRVSTGNTELKQRGDGIQAKLIPEVLNYISIRENQLTSRGVRQGEKSKKYFIWGFEEPENSYEYRNAQLLADRFKDKFIQNAQIFITTHSFNFIELSGDEVAKYRVWKDSNIQSSKISKIKERDGELNFGTANGDNSLKEELGFFHLTKSISGAYQEFQKASQTYKDKLQNITKPVVFSEGNNVEYLKIAQKLFPTGFDYDIQNGGGAGDMKNIVKAFYQLDLQFKNIFIFDCDVTKEYKDSKLLENDLLHIYRFEKNTQNTKIQKGIENMFDVDMFIEGSEFYQSKKVTVNKKIISQSYELDKPKFLKHIQENHKTVEAFHNFNEVQKLIKEKLINNA